MLLLCISIWIFQDGIHQDYLWKPGVRHASRIGDPAIPLCLRSIFCLDILCGTSSAKAACSMAPFVLLHVTSNVQFLCMCVFAHQEHMISLTTGWIHHTELQQPHLHPKGHEVQPTLTLMEIFAEAP